MSDSEDISITALSLTPTTPLPYTGSDVNTSPTYYCKQCYKTRASDNSNLRKCARCKTLYYCCINCQRKDYIRHRAECGRLYNLSRDLKREADKLRYHRGWFGNQQPHNLFVTNPGHFWGILDTREYCSTRYELQSELSDIAYHYEVRPLLEIVLHHQLELLRLIASDNLGLRDIVPFTLLSLNRDDDAYAFIKHWVPILQTGPDMTDLHMATTPGEWIYPRGQDKHEDVLEVFNCDEKYFSLAFLAALCIIKLRIIAAYDVARGQMDAFADTRMGRRLGDALLYVENARMGVDAAAVIEEQERHVERYFRVMQKNNPTLLPAIVNPGPLKSQPQPACLQPGTPSEAWEVLRRCNRHFLRIPGVQQRIESIVGKNPSYEYVIHHDLYS